MTNKKELIYIGTAVNLKIRLSKHPIILVARAFLNETSYNHIIVKCKIVSDTVKRKFLERSLINRIKPKVNFA